MQCTAWCSGYCEQFDIHSPRTTVVEALMFSCRMRFNEEISPAASQAFVDEVGCPCCAAFWEVGGDMLCQRMPRGTLGAGHGQSGTHCGCTMLDASEGILVCQVMDLVELHPNKDSLVSFAPSSSLLSCSLHQLAACHRLHCDPACSSMAQQDLLHTCALPLKLQATYVLERMPARQVPCQRMPRVWHSCTGGRAGRGWAQRGAAQAHDHCSRAGCQPQHRVHGRAHFRYSARLDIVTTIFGLVQPYAGHSRTCLRDAAGCDCPVCMMQLAVNAPE